MKLINKAATLLVAGTLGLGLSVASHAAGDAAAGQGKTAMCGACHGADGNSMIPNFPKLAGQGEAYIAKQLHDIRSGARSVPEMTGMTENLSEQDIADIAAYYHAQKVQVGQAKKDLVEHGQELYRAGKPEAGVAACAGCHGANGHGMPGAAFPALSGQHEAYIAKQLKAFRAAGREDETGDRRTNDGETMMMRATAGRLSDNDIKALSSYINGLH
ncbi:cytochrome c, class I [gamma proteobacterium HdN1]|nr:cytochrome c, class I [gamma proteobacterium HdN1]